MHPKISDIKTNKQNSDSAFSQWNKGINLAKGELIWIAESDDIAENTFSENLINGIGLNKSVVLAYSQSSRINAKSQIIGSWFDWTKSMTIDFSKDFVFSGGRFY